ncbi:hypothetical protein [Streptomyces sp. ICBB 8177]|uniref:hypothetical protein n=1 Tax=Streptomyces sp. ICBB 8177 TaxID=563922 RepID=UPI0011B5C605|nr:hypothetical protein [Streptomyces sp. ICBB 8177]
MGFNADFARAPSFTLGPGAQLTQYYWWDSRLQAGNWHRMAGCPDNQDPPSSMVQIVAEYQRWNNDTNLVELWVTWKNPGTTIAEVWPTIAMVPAAN